MKTLKTLSIVDVVKVVGLVLHTSFREGRNKIEVPPFFHQVLEEGRLTTFPYRLNQNQLCVFKMTPNSPDFDMPVTRWPICMCLFKPRDFHPLAVAKTTQKVKDLQLTNVKVTQADANRPV